MDDDVPAAGFDRLHVTRSGPGVPEQVRQELAQQDVRLGVAFAGELAAPGAIDACDPAVAAQIDGASGLGENALTPIGRIGKQQDKDQRSKHGHLFRESHRQGGAAGVVDLPGAVDQLRLRGRALHLPAPGSVTVRVPAVPETVIVALCPSSSTSIGPPSAVIPSPAAFRTRKSVRPRLAPWAKL